MRQLASIILLTCFALLGSGALEHLHNLDHQREDTQTALLAKKAGLPATPAPVHNENNCATHAQLHMPALAAGWTPLLVCLGLFVSFLSLLTPAPVSHRPIIRLDCRGPPAC